MSVDVPHFLPDGSALWMDSEFMKYLHEGKPEIGWEGDPRLAPYLFEDRIQIRRADENGNYRHIIMQSRPGVRTLGMEALIFLAEHDSQSRRKYDVVADINEHNRRVQAGRDADSADLRGEAVDRLAHALLRDIGAYEGGSSRRFFAGVNIPGRKKGKK